MCGRQTSSGDFFPSLFPFHSANASQWNLFTTKCTIDCIISLFCSAVGILSCFTHLVRFKAAYTLLHIILFPTLPVGLNIIRKTGALTFKGVYWIFFFCIRAQSLSWQYNVHFCFALSKRLFPPHPGDVVRHSYKFRTFCTKKLNSASRKSYSSCQNSL